MRDQPRILFVLLPALMLAATWSAAADPSDPDFDRVVNPFLKSHCYECHGEDEQQSRIRYDQLPGFTQADRHLWTLVHQQLSAGTMPPEGDPRPKDEESQQVLRWIEQRQKASGTSAVRRLNRRELSAALQDVTGSAVDFAYSLPGDGVTDGFDTGADALQDSADSITQVMQATRRAVEAIRFIEPARGKIWAADVRDAKDARKIFDAWKADGISSSTGDVVTLPGTGWLIKPKWLGDRGGLTIRIPSQQDGIVRVRLEVSARKFVEGLPNPHLWVEVGGRDLAYVEIDNSPDEPKVLIYEVPLRDVAHDAKGLPITLISRVEMPYAVPGFVNEEKGKPEENIPGGTGLFRPLFDAKSLPVDQQPIPFIVLHRFEIELDYRQQWPPASWHSGLGEITDTRQSAQRLLQLWMDRAWRRPVAPAEQARFLALYEKLRGQGQSFDDALRSTFQSTLMAGSFRYLVAPTSDKIQSQHAVASRLGFMLWGAPPDEQLRELARAGKLLDAQVLAEQVNRLLADPRSAAFVRSFVTQWLEMGQPITVAMDHIQKQDFRFGRNLKASMQAETVAYFAQMLADNRPARELIASDWAMLNDILARHYGYEKLAGGQLRKVALPKGDPRGGGVLGQAGIQSMLCWMGDNWVIYRGAWTLRRILDDPPPAAPLEVPELMPSDSKNRGKPFKELLRQHQENSKCAVCHKSMDPLGFAFQNFDLSGRWRDVEYDHYETSDLDGKIAWRGVGKTRPVDASGKLPRGETFQSFGECKALLVTHYTPDLVRGLMKHLLLYGAGRKADVEDLAAIKSIIQQHAERGYPLRDLLVALVKSPVFMSK